MLAYAKYAGAGILAAAFLVFMWNVSSWRADAMQLKVAKIELRNELERRVASDAARLDMQNKLTAAQEALQKKLNKTLDTIHSHEPKGPDCDIPDDVVSQLSKLRSGP